MEQNGACSSYSVHPHINAADLSSQKINTFSFLRKKRVTHYTSYPTDDDKITAKNS
jgi:hypothetical protein